jgi:hypothetical protein
MLPQFIDHSNYSAKGELNDECLQGAEHCMLTDGSSGECVLNGECKPSMAYHTSFVEKPYCFPPEHAAGCVRHCNCVKMSDGNTNIQQCVQRCQTHFPVITQVYPNSDKGMNLNPDFSYKGTSTNFTDFFAKNGYNGY